MKENITDFSQYCTSLPEERQQQLVSFFAELDRHMVLPRRDRIRMREDFEQALLYYHSEGVSPEEALSRIAVEHLGGFYSRPSVLWYPLDDAAKVYPLSMHPGQMVMFRLSVYLKQDVVPALLQLALTFTIKRFPGFAATVKKGVFWHYLDSTKRRYPIEGETDVPCQPMPLGRSGAPAFRVLYYHNRISVEFFHSLTDGTGGLVFLKALVSEYFRLLGIAHAPSADIPDLFAAPHAEELSNAFAVVDKEKAGGFIDKPVIQLGGRLAIKKPCGVVHFKLPLTKLKEVTAAYRTTVTAFLLALHFLAAKSATDEYKGEFSIQVPVNMRKFYPHRTLRNFSMYCGVRLRLEEITGIADILPSIAKQLKEKTAKKPMDGMVLSARRLVGSLRLIPLVVKAPVVRLVYSFLGDKIFTTTLSNLGVVTFPPELAPQIIGMDFVLGAAETNRASCSVVTCGDVVTLSISKCTADPSFEEALYRLLCAEGLEPTVEGSEPC